MNSTGSEAVSIRPWVLVLAVNLAIQLLSAAYQSGTVTAGYEALSGRVERLERQIDSISNITRSPKGYVSPPVSSPNLKTFP